MLGERRPTVVTLPSRQMTSSMAVRERERDREKERDIIVLQGTRDPLELASQIIVVVVPNAVPTAAVPFSPPIKQVAHIPLGIWKESFGVPCPFCK